MFFIPLLIGIAAGAIVAIKGKDKIKEISKPITDVVGHLANELKEALKDAREKKANDL